MATPDYFNDFKDNRMTDNDFSDDYVKACIRSEREEIYGHPDLVKQNSILSPHLDQYSQTQERSTPETRSSPETSLTFKKKSKAEDDQNQCSKTTKQVTKLLKKCVDHSSSEDYSIATKTASEAKIIDSLSEQEDDDMIYVPFEF